MDNRQFYKSQYPVLVVSRIMGLAPFSINLDLETEWVKLSFPWLVYSLALYCGYLYSFAYSLEVVWVIPLQRNYPFISIIGHMLQMMLGVVIFNVCYIVNFCKAKKMSSIGFALYEVDVELTRLGSPSKDLVDHQKAHRVKWSCFSGCLIFFVLMTVFDCWVFRDLYGDYIFLMSFAYIIPYFIACVMQMQFMNLISIIRERFDVINRFLQHIATVNENYTKLADQSVDFLTKDLSLNPPPSGSAKNPKKAFLPQQAKNESFDPDLHLKLHDIFRVHDKLCDLIEEVNECFSFQMVVCITGIFILMIFGLFFEAKVVFWAWGGAIKLVLISTSYMIWGFISAGVTYLVLFLCTNARDSANQSALIIHKILQMKPAFMLNDEAYYNKMKSFTLQILHRKNILHFNGLGLFRLDYTFIFSAVSAATSYLIVLLQFDLTNELQAFSSNKFY